MGRGPQEGEENKLGSSPSVVLFQKFQKILTPCFFFRMKLGMLISVLLATLMVQGVTEEVSPQVSYVPSMGLATESTLDAIEKSGVFIRDLGTCLLERGSYRIVTPIDFGILEVRLDS